jgi:hypothetical protein
MIVLQICIHYRSSTTEGEQSASRSGRFTPEVRTLVPIDRRFVWSEAVRALLYSINRDEKEIYVDVKC